MRLAGEFIPFTHHKNLDRRQPSYVIEWPPPTPVRLSVSAVLHFVTSSILSPPTPPTVHNITPPLPWRPSRQSPPHRARPQPPSQTGTSAPSTRTLFPSVSATLNAQSTVSTTNERNGRRPLARRSGTCLPPHGPLAYTARPYTCATRPHHPIITLRAAMLGPYPQDTNKQAGCARRQ